MKLSRGLSIYLVSILFAKAAGAPEPMINYSLNCSNDHRFDSWFQSADAYDKLRMSGMVACAVCGDTNVDKAIMAPSVQPARNTASDAGTKPTPERPLSAPANPAEEALAKLRRHVEQTSDYVGDRFASEARAMHEGVSPERAIYGEARPDEARALIEDGVPVAPLPFHTGRKTN